MRLTQCDKFKNHYYDADKFTSCPHCAKLGISAEPAKKKGLFDRLKSGDDNVSQNIAQPYDASNDKTVMLTNVLYENELEQTPQSKDDSVASQLENVGVSGSVADIKTVAMYGFEEDTEPVVGWLVAISGSDKGVSYNLKSGKNFLGRSGSGNEVDISLDNDHSVSRGAQAVVIYEPKGKNFLLQTTNGSSLVYLNDNLLMTYTGISAYDKITLGETDLLFVPFCSDKFSW